MTASSSPFAVAWIPNISGTVSEPCRLEARLDGLESASLVSALHHVIRCTGHLVSVSVGDRIRLDFEFSDDRGICLVYDRSETGLAPSEREIQCRSSREIIRSRMDGTSEYCRCPAMKRPVPIDGSRATDALVKRFISSLESITDFDAFVDRRDSNRAAVYQLAEDAASRSNILYFDRFIDMFHEDIEGDIADYRSQIRCRTDKYDLISHCHEEERRIFNEDRIAVSNEAIRDYSDRTLELTMTTNREARFSKWIAIASMLFAGSRCSRRWDSMRLCTPNPADTAVIPEVIRSAMGSDRRIGRIRLDYM